jgi:bla regulator protein BlaR1
MGQVLISAFVDKMIPAFGWMLIHSLWEGLLFAIIAGAVLMLAKKANAAYRYNLVLVLFVGFTAACAFTFIYELNSTIAGTSGSLLPGNGGTATSALFFGNIHGFKHFIKTLSAYFSANEPLLVLIWFIIFLFKSVKMMGCLVYNQQIRNRQVSGPPEFWVKTANTFAEKLKIKKAVTLLQSGYIKMPVVVGHLKPVILIPVGLLAGLPTEQVEAILLHELAHVRRNDYFVNFLQNITETIFFFNPGLLWISSLLREERENCCDDIALEQTQNKVGFVQALISFKEHEMYGSSYAVAFPGKRNYLMRRVSRILGNKNMTFGLGEKIFFIGSILVLSVLMTAASVARIKEYAKSGFKKPHTIVASAAVPVGPLKAIAATSATVTQALKTEIKRVRTKTVIKMKNGISGIQERTTPVKPINEVIQPIAAAELNSKRELSEKEQGQRDQEQARKDQEQARLDQEQAIKDQAAALKDQAQAKIDQAQAVKDQEQAKNQEQSLLNESQAGKNQQQDKRNEAQVRLNKIQVKKNEAQAIRNEEQARLNEVQERKNEEEAKKNIVSVQ